ncbi:MAG: asparagine synthase (glutamine-hydrolyzing) [Alphaproteobacteria bacterium]
MCGIAGLLELTPSSGTEALSATATAMAATLVHRGPDDDGVWVDGEAGIGLAFRRLAIIDLSPAGHQPLVSSCGACVLVYNGEIYNAPELRRELEQRGRVFRGHCDSEVLVEACAEWGVDAALGRLNGMFAFALWHRQSRSLTLARDRLGIKPLYWGRVGDSYLFGSELKALRAHPAWQGEVDRDALAAYIRHLYVPSPHSIYRGIHKLAPGQTVTLAAGAEPKVAAYWDLRGIARDTPRETVDDDEATARLEAALKGAVRRRMVADVPLGAFLSGGIDSSLIVALMQDAASSPVQTYSVGFDEAEFDEAPFAKAVAGHLGTDHTELYVSAQDALDLVPDLPDCYDEPFADSSAMPTMLVSRLARKSVTVALSGDGGDEIFGGYKRYYRADVLRRRLGLAPAALRRGAAAALRAWPSGSRYGAYRRGRAADHLAAPDEVALYRSLVSYVADPAALVLGATEPRGVLFDSSVAHDIPDFMERCGFFDSVTSLPDQMLAKVDRASMASGLEVRVPLLDHGVVELAWRLAPSVKYSGRDENKRLLRAILYNYVPRPLVDRRKRGFGVPIAAWLRGPLKDWAEAQLNSRRLFDEGFFDVGTVRAIWAEHLSGAGDWQRVLWRLLMFQAWLEREGAAS